MCFTKEKKGDRIKFVRVFIKKKTLKLLIQSMMHIQLYCTSPYKCNKSFNLLIIIIFFILLRKNLSTYTIFKIYFYRNCLIISRTKKSLNFQSRQ